jgi:hypothetical protein
MLKKLKEKLKEFLKKDSTKIEKFYDLLEEIEVRKSKVSKESEDYKIYRKLEQKIIYKICKEKEQK